MDNQGWIKLHRKLADHEILKDATSLQIFIWLLLSVDRNTGKYTTGRFVASQVLGMKPRTFHKALSERLQHRYNLVTLSSDNKKTTISLNNWDKYQLSSDTSSDKLVTPKGQQSDTKQEVRIKKDIYNQQADPKLIKSVLGYEFKKPVASKDWQLMAVDYAQKLGFTPTSSWFKFFREGSVGKLQEAYAKMHGLNLADPEKYFYKIYGVLNDTSSNK